MKRFVTALALFGIVGSVNAGVNSATKAASDKLGANMVSEIDFSEGATQPSKSEMAEVNDLIAKAKSQGKIDEIRIIAWADREYPGKGEKAPSSSVKLADERADHLKNYLRDELKVGSVNTFNMAKRANAVQEFLKTPTAKVKDSMEDTGAAPTAKEDTGLFGLKGKASKALVLVYLK